MANDRTRLTLRTAMLLPAVLAIALPCLAGPTVGMPQPPEPLQTGVAGSGMVLTADDAKPRDGRPGPARPQAQRNAPRPRAPTGPDARGRTLQPEQRGQPMDDYRRFRLRTPPPGYSWRRVGDHAYLVSDETGTVTEAVPLGH